MPTITITETAETIENNRRNYCRNRRKRFWRTMVAISHVESVYQSALQRLGSIQEIKDANIVHVCLNMGEFGCHYGGSYSHLLWINKTPKRKLRVWANLFKNS